MPAAGRIPDEHFRDFVISWPQAVLMWKEAGT
jgi:hypothetical protein